MASIFDEIVARTRNDVWAMSLPNNRGEGREQHKAGRDPERLLRWSQDQDAAGFGQFYCIASIQQGSPRRKEFARELAFIHCDVDGKDLDEPLDEIERRLLGLELVPSRLHFTGRGYHPLWRLAEPLLLPAGQERAEALMKKITNALGGDPQVCQVVSLLRVPTTHNTKNGAWTPVTVVREGRETYSIEQLEDWVDGLRGPIMVRRGTETDPFSRYGNDRSTSTYRAPVDVEERLATMEVKGPGDKGIHATHLSVTASLTAAGVGEDEQVALIMGYTQNLPGTEGWDWRREERDLRRMVQDMQRKLEAQGREPEPVSLADAQKTRKARKERAIEKEALPLVKVHAGELPELAKRSEELLIEAEVGIYARGGVLVRPIIETTDASHGRKTKTARLVTIVAVYMRNVLGTIARWERFDKRTKKYHPADVPTEIAPILLANEGDWQFPTIAGVITTPTMRPDGTILDQEGYDEATRLLLIEPPPMPPIPEAPTKTQAKAALKVLEDLLVEFPFVDEVAKAVALSALLTPIVRGAFAVSPMHVSRAPAAGSGKSFLWDTVATIASGRLMPVVAAGKTEEETEKRLGSAMMTGQPLISVDNVNGQLAGDFLCQAIERPIVEVRILGKSELMRIEARGTSIFGTGNNIGIVGDLCRRVITTTLDPRMENPEHREFMGDPIATIMADRGKYIAAALTVCRAYVAAGRPNRAKPLASFGGWSDTVRSALLWLGKADPVASMEVARADDPERTELRDVIAAWASVVGVGRRYRRTLSDLIEIAGERSPGGNFAYEWPELNAALSAVGGG